MASREAITPFIHPDRFQEFAKSKNVFWSAVSDCLVQFHGLPQDEAKLKSEDLYNRIESSPEGVASEIFYHNEPFYVACDLAGKELNLSEYFPAYISLLTSRNDEE